jgi:hypothetical protein
LPAEPSPYSLVGSSIMGVSSHPCLAVPYGLWIGNWCGGHSGNTNDSGDAICKHGPGCVGSKPASHTCLRIGMLRRRLDDRSRMSREAHVRFWDGVCGGGSIPLRYSTTLTPTTASPIDAPRSAGTWRSSTPSGDTSRWEGKRRIRCILGWLTSGGRRNRKHTYPAVQNPGPISANPQHTPATVFGYILA